MIQAALLGAGMVIKGIGQLKANMDQADAESKNASWYREQAAYARQVGDRQRSIFEDESQLLYGEQLSAFAKAGVDTSSSSLFMAKTMISRQDESYAIKKEADMNVRIAMLRADQAEATANQLRDPINNILQIGGGLLSGAGQSGLFDGGGGGGSQAPQLSPWAGSGQGSGPLASYRNK